MRARSVCCVAAAFAAVGLGVKARARPRKVDEHTYGISISIYLTMLTPCLLSAVCAFAWVGLDCRAEQAHEHVQQHHQAQLGEQDHPGEVLGAAPHRLHGQVSHRFKRGGRGVW